MIAWFKSHWQASGTKILGWLASGWATFTALLAYLSADPQVQLLVPHKYFVILALVNVFIGFFTVKRGFTNTRNLNGPPP